MQGRKINSEGWKHHAWINRMQSLLLLGFLGSYLALLGWILWGVDGVVMLLVMAFVFVIVNPTISPRLIMYLYGAQPITPTHAPDHYAVVHELAKRSGLTFIPALYYVPSPMVNAITVGKNEESVIAVTDGLLRVLEPREQIGVLAHVMSHIRGNDMWVMGLADTLSRMTGVLSLFGQVLLLINLPMMMMGKVTISWLAILILIMAPTLSALAQLGLSRTREYDADLNAAVLTGDPEGLARALVKIERIQGNWLERLFLPGRRLPEPSLLRTHPPTDERVRRLMEFKRDFEQDALSHPDPESLQEMLNARKTRRRPRWHISGLWH